MTGELTAGERLEARLALEDLNSAFARHLDHNEIDALVDLFAVDALYTHGERISRGRDEIERLFRARAAKGPRTSRHLLSGLRLSIESATEAAGTSVCLSFAADGSPPLPARPFLVADFDDRYRRDRDGRWRFAERHIRRVFVGDGG
jgi:ketosteroid isomerase-like protein